MRSLNGFVKNVQHEEHGERVDIEIDGPDEVAKRHELEWEQVAIGGEGLDWQSLGPTYQTMRFGSLASRIISAMAGKPAAARNGRPTLCVCCRRAGRYLRPHPLEPCVPPR
jgi:hypothetical protein